MLQTEHIPAAELHLGPVSTSVEFLSSVAEGIRGLPSGEEAFATAKHLHSALTDRRFPVDVLFSNRVDGNRRQWLLKWLGFGEDLSPAGRLDMGQRVSLEVTAHDETLALRIALLNDLPLSRWGSPDGWLAIVALGPDLDQAEARSALEELGRLHPMVLVLSEETLPSDHPLAAPLDSCWCVHRMRFEDLPEGLGELVLLDPWRANQGFLRAGALTFAAERYRAFLESFLVEEQERVAARLTLADLRSKRLREQLKEEDASTAKVPIADSIRDEFREQFDEFIKQAKSSLDRLLHPKNGEAWSFVDPQLEQLELQAPLEDGHYRPFVPESTRLGLLTSLREPLMKLASELTKDLEQLKAYLTENVADVVFKKLTGASSPITFLRLEAKRFVDLADAELQFAEREPFKIKRLGPIDAFKRAKGAVMQIMMMAGFLIGAIAVVDPSFKQTAMQAVGVVGVIVTIGIFLLNAFWYLPREKDKSLAEETKKLREALRQEMNKITADIQRGWLDTLRSHVDGQIDETVETQVVEALRVHLGRLREDTSQKIQERARQADGLKSRAKLITERLKELRGHDKALAGLRKDLAKKARSIFGDE